MSKKKTAKAAPEPEKGKSPGCEHCCGCGCHLKQPLYISYPTWVYTPYVTPTTPWWTYGTTYTTSSASYTPTTANG